MRIKGRGGTALAPVKVLAYPGEVPILDGSDMPKTLGSEADGIALSIQTSYTFIRGIHVRRAAAGGILVTGSNNRLEQVATYENGRGATWDGTGLRVQGRAANNLFLSVDSYLNRDWLGRGDNADGFAFHSEGSGNIFRDCRAWLNSDDGFDFFNASDNTRQGAAVVEASQAWRNGYAADGITPLGDGRGFKMAGQRASGNGNTTGVSGGHTFRFNLAWNNRRVGFDDNDARIPLAIEHNLGFGNGMFDFYLGGEMARSVARWNRAGRAYIRNVANISNSWRYFEQTTVRALR
jgi:hypothetical protein